MLRGFSIGLAIAGGVLGLSCGGGTPSESDLPVIRAGSFTFPALASVMAEIVRAKEFDRAHGFRLEVHAFGTVATYYAALARGEVDTVAGGPLIFQRMRGQGIPVVATNTYASLASLVVIAGPPELENFNDLAGRTLAADLGSSEHSLLGVLAKRRGLVLGKDVRVLQAAPPVARAHLMTGEADAILTFEPTATLVLQDDPRHHVVFNGQQEWEAFGLGAGWLLISLFRQDFVTRSPELIPRFVAALREAATFVAAEPREADQLVSSALSLESGVLLEAVDEGRIRFEIQEAAAQREALQRMFQIGIESGFADFQPGPDAIFSPTVSVP